MFSVTFHDFATEINNFVNIHMFGFISELLLVESWLRPKQQIGNNCSISGFREVGGITDDATGKFFDVANPGSRASGEQQCGDYESTLKSELLIV